MDCCCSSPVFLLLALSLLLAAPPLGAAEQAGAEQSSGGGAEIVRRALVRRCAHNYTLTCLKMDVASLMDGLSARDAYTIVPSVSVVRAGADEGSGPRLPEAVVRDLARGLPEEEDAVRRLDAHLHSALEHYMASHAVSVNLGAAARSLGERLMQAAGADAASGRGKGGGGFGGGKKGGLGMLGAMMIMSKATVGAIAMGGLALLAGKALIVGLLSLLLSAIVGIKALSSSSSKGSVTYEIVQKPVYSHAHSHSHEEIHSGGGHGGGHGGYRRRSYDVDDDHAHRLAYGSYAPPHHSDTATGVRRR
ncbi:uncharacterized protein LOC124174161 [Ischnura elegans]|uniref:uncharacterized protein LOC124174161 n=1 Tax=Ischnura elegans TaxID=197161 RepID=UPI001ED89E9F|nr:uncharacterized protein LOC124174161 [Ischnura elegans]